jgi:hypothetical protein
MTAQALDERMSKRTDAPEVASYRTMVRRLPMTLRPALNGQLAEWETLFPFERQRVQDFMRGVASFDASALAELLEPMRKLETQMGVDHWDFSEAGDTMENASLLARSAYYSEWRNQVRRIYSVIEEAAHASPQAINPPQPRLVVAILPESLPFDRSTVWRKWKNCGVEVSIEGDATLIADRLLKSSPSISEILALQGRRDISDLWLIDAGSTLEAKSGGQIEGSFLSSASLAMLRERILARVNTVPKSIEITDQTLATIRKMDWNPWWPPEISDRAPLRKFVIDLYLSGNGALIFSNAFVEWAASEAIRRARPRVLFARFGVRAKPKPFTGIAIFENQQQISKLPDVKDPQGSAIDANVLARYILLSAQRYPEGAQTVFLCIAESAQSAYLVAPVTFTTRWLNSNKATPEHLAELLIRHLSQ